MLGFEDALCSRKFGQGNSTSPIWMDDLNCSGDETALDLCYFEGWGTHNCRHDEDAGIACVDGTYKRLQ